MKKIALGLVLLLGGAATGGGGGWALLTFMPQFAPQLGQGSEATSAKADQTPTALVPTGRVLAPLVYKDGSLAGYTGFQVQVEVPEADAAAITARLPLLLHAINMRTYKAPLAAGPDGLIPDLDVLRTIVQQAADESLGKGEVRRVLVTEAAPA